MTLLVALPTDAPPDMAGFGRSVEELTLTLRNFSYQLATLADMPEALDRGAMVRSMIALQFHIDRVTDTLEQTAQTAAFYSQSVPTLHRA